jgi:hypothetical protein
MKPRSSLDSRLLALITVAFSVLCASALWIELVQTPDAHWAAAQA